MADVIRAALDEHEKTLRATREQLMPAIEAAAIAIHAAIQRDGRVFAFGNGGSAADAQHLAAELVGRFRVGRRPIPALALTTDSSVLTAIANDYEFADVFSRQVEALVRPADAVVAISTSGDSENVVRGLEAAKRRRATTIALVGGSGGRLAPLATHALTVPSDVTARIQEMHVLIIHAICERLEELIGSA